MSDDTPTRPTPRSLMSAVSGSAVASAVVPVQPDDQLDVVAARVREAGAPHVQLLIPAGALAFRSPRSFRALRVLLSGQDAQLLVVSGDPATLEAARQAGVETLGLEAPGQAPRAPTGSVQPATPRADARAIDDNDAAFLRDLDQVGGEPVTAGDDLDETLLEPIEPVPPPRPATRPIPTDAIRRLSDESSPALARPRSRQRSERMAQAAEAEVLLPAPPRRVQRALPEEEAAPPRRRSISPNLVMLLVIAGLLAAGALWAVLNRVTVEITPPAGVAREQPFENEVMPLSSSPTTSPAVQALPVDADAEVTFSGQVLSETVSPVGRAKGQVRIVNTIEQPVPLTAGTELVGRNAEGAEVRFALDAPATVPPAVTTASETGRTTTYGEISVAVTARSAGSASNVGANAITQVIIPGQPPLVSDRSNFLIRHDAIGGGTEEPQRVVTEAEVRRVLGEALTNLYNNGLGALQAEASAQGLAVDPSTVSPSVTELGDPARYEDPIVSPPLGSAVDPNNPTFTVTIRTRFDALAAPADRPVTQQLEEVIPLHFSQRPSPPCTPAETQAVRDVTWSWDGERLAMRGTVVCTPLQSVPPETLAKVRAALVDQSREAAVATLDLYQEQGLIGGYHLPDREQLPPFEVLIEVRVATPEAAPAGP